MKFYCENAETVISELSSDANGLTSGEAERRLAEHGKNKLAEGKKDSIIKQLLKQLADPMIIILLVAAAISGVLAVTQGESFADVIIILAVVIVNAVLGVYQENKAEKAIEALQEMSAATSKVLRDGKIVSVRSEELTIGDVVLLEAGDAVPADGRIIENASLKIEEAALTGESVPVSKFIDAINLADSADVPLGDRKNMAYMGSTVVYGRGAMIVTAVGMQTEMGKIADALANAQEGQTPLQIKLTQLSKVLTWLVLGICAAVFAVQLLRAGGIDFETVLSSFMIAVSLAVAAIPEGLAAVVTVVLSIGVTNMSKRNAIIRKLTAVETLGCAQIICSDKTGTLTQNKMTVVRCAGAAGELNGQDKDALLSAAALCTSVEGSGEKLLGDPTETAIVAAISDWERLQKQRVKAAEVPFTAERRRMTVVLRTEGGYRVITKGAPEAILPRCTYVLLNGKNVTLTPEMRAALSAKNRDMANDALRVLAAAEKRTEACPETDDAAENGLCFLGLIGLEDPPRPEAAEAVSECKRAGIRPVMITGDQPATASAIAGRLGIENKAVMTGAELESLSDDALLQTVQTCSVYARVSPAHKMRIIKAFRRLKLVTAMTGDGVNDAPALKAADIGCAMGKNGTEVAKNAADMVLTDDNFATIVSAVREGRTVYGNIRKTIHFLMSCNIGEILVVLVSFLLRTPTPLLPAQLLWVNLVTDSLPALALGSDPPQGDVMRRPPTARDSSAFSNGLGFAMAAEGMMIGALALLAFTVGRVFFDADPMQPAVGRTMAFAVLSLSQLVHSYNMRSTGPVLGRGMFKNRGLNVSFLICSALMAGVVVFPQAAALFGSVPLTLTQWGIVAILALLPLPICEMQKRILSRTAKVKNMTSGVKKRVIFNK